MAEEKQVEEITPEQLLADIAEHNGEIQDEDLEKKEDE